MKVVKWCFYTSLLGLLFLDVQSQQLRVMSYNIHHGADRNENNTLDSIGYFIRDTKPDIVGLQEVDSICERSGKVDQMKKLGAITGMYYAFVRHFPYQGGAYGVGVLSRYPIEKVEPKVLRLLKKGPNGESVSMLFATVQIKKKKKILFATAHYSAYDKTTRTSQVNETLNYLSESKLPVVFTGDLNATPDTDEIQLLQQHLRTTDALGTFTFPDITPVKKIDYILISPSALRRIKKVTAPQVHYSDHLPFVANIVLKLK
ncbi:MAG TPA: endonuclease/exonuclease/phosphatase family protein [Agriterribacter sp.]|nr:endonuclease/exonuclease/phosphatase family protein [Agriterribacter sp.]HRQ52092.1 endonuclease/exonuclease/phosphatase family protein [Agriterribacter sp.]